MSDSDLRGALSEIATDARPVDLYDRALRRSRQLRRRRTAGAAVSAAVAVFAVSGVLWQLLPGNEPAQPAQTATVTPTATDGPPLDLDELLSDATFTFPDWPGPNPELNLGTCPTGPMQLPHDSLTPHLYVQGALLDQVDGETHLVAQFACRGTGEGDAGIVAAYRVDGKTLTLIGKIVDTALAPGEGAWARIEGISPGSSQGSIRVVLSDRLVIDDPALTPYSPLPYHLVKQERAYTWDGSAYAQTGGPSSFRASPSVNVAVSPSSLVFGAAEGPCRDGTMTVTMTNDGAAPVEGVAVMVAVPGLGWPSSDCSWSPVQDYDSALAQVGALGVGESRSVLVEVRVDTRCVGPVPPSPCPQMGTAARFAGGTPFAQVRLAGGQQWTGVEVPFAVEY